ncbi:MAG: hypothetical protein CEE38_11520 [Planctomycetes bacterium B3_Pla]|nr:MAG: hypothetical protein CEE38_11520 [Planctomycetes bacterium B3_Pla]
MREKEQEPKTGAETEETEHRKLRKRRWITGLVLLAILLAAPATWLTYFSQFEPLKEHPGLRRETWGPIWFRRFADKWNLPVPKRAISFRGPHAIDKDMTLVTKVRSLRVLLLDRSSLTDAGLAHLHKLRNLQILSLFGTNVTDEGLGSLSGLVNLRHLDLSGTQVTDEGLEHLRSLKQLTTLILMDTRVTPEGVARLKVAIPSAKIIASR